MGFASQTKDLEKCFLAIESQTKKAEKWENESDRRRENVKIVLATERSSQKVLEKKI